MSEEARPVTTRTALKEWAVACAALGRGDQILLLRKGGISEEHKDFRIEHPEFLLFPTYEHQRADLLKPEARPDLERVLAERGPTDRLELRYWAAVRAVFDVTSSAQLRAIAELHLWSDGYAEDRLRWKPVKPLQVLALRVFQLADPISLPLRPEYGGCKSWLTLAEPVELAGAKPVLSDEQFEQRLALVGDALQRAGTEVSAP